MLKGQAAINWTPENDAKLFLTVLAVQGIQVDYNSVAAAFGPDIPGSCIQTRMKVLRKKANELGVTPLAKPASATKRARAPANPAPSKKAKVAKKIMEEVLSDEEEESKVIVATPPSIASAGDDSFEEIGTLAPSKKAMKAANTKSLVSPRKASKKDYKALGDPFPSMEDGNNSNGENLFRNVKTESEDSAASDKEFDLNLIKTEMEI